MKLHANHTHYPCLFTTVGAIVPHAAGCVIVLNAVAGYVEWDAVRYERLFCIFIPLYRIVYKVKKLSLSIAVLVLT
jgi:hypothetical protein